MRREVVSLVLPLGLIGLMLTSILTGKLYTVEADAIGAIAITIHTLFRRELTWQRLGETVREVMRLCAVVFTLMMSAMTFTLVFRIMGGDVTITKLLAEVPGRLRGATLLVLGLSLGLCGDPVWFAVMFAIAIQSGFMMPQEIYAGVVTLLAIQVVVLTCFGPFRPSRRGFRRRSMGIEGRCLKDASCCGPPAPSRIAPGTWTSAGFVYSAGLAHPTLHSGEGAHFLR